MVRLYLRDAGLTTAVRVRQIGETHDARMFKRGVARRRRYRTRSRERVARAVAFVRQFVLEHGRAPFQHELSSGLGVPMMPSGKGGICSRLASWLGRGSSRSGHRDRFQHHRVWAVYRLAGTRHPALGAHLKNFIPDRDRWLRAWREANPEAARQNLVKARAISAATRALRKSQNG